MGAEGTKHTRFSHAAFRRALGSFLDNFMIGLSNTLQRNYFVDGCEVQFGDRQLKPSIDLNSEMGFSATGFKYRHRATGITPPINHL